MYISTGWGNEFDMESVTKTIKFRGLLTDLVNKGSLYYVKFKIIWSYTVFNKNDKYQSYNYFNGTPCIFCYFRILNDK